MKSALIGQQLGDYTLVRVLATGGMSRIYEGLDKRLNRRAAIKVLDMSADPQDTDALRVRFEREARALAKLEHPHIIAIYQFGEQDGLYFIAMKLIEGGDLAGELKDLRRTNQTMPPARAIAILEQIADALDTAHAAHIVHRDIKPSNILIDLQDRATLTDFGLVIEPSIDATFGTAFGTPRYISPEQATDSSRAVPQSDIYSLGVVVYELLTGQTPFDGRSPMEVAISHLNDAPPPPRSLNILIPQAVETAILRALAKEARERFATAGAFVAAVRQGYQDAGLLLDDTAALGRTTALPGVAKKATGSSRPARRRSVWLPVFGVGLLMVVTIGALATLLAPSRAVVLTATPSAVSAVIATPAAIIDNTTTADAVITTPAAITDAATAVVTTNNAGIVPAESAIPVITSTPGILDGLALVYDTASLILLNNTDSAIDLSAFTITRAESGAALFSGTQLVGSALPARTCFRIRAQAQRADLPRECGGQLYGEYAPQDNAALFWLADGFVLRIGDAVLRVCGSARDAARC